MGYNGCQICIIYEIESRWTPPSDSLYKILQVLYTEREAKWVALLPVRLIFDNQAFANHRAMAAVLGVILRLPPLKQMMASKQFKSIYLDKLLSKKNT